jgi:hypothetical protein
MPDCGCAMAWAGDELVLRLCEKHREQMIPPNDRFRYAGPPQLRGLKSPRPWSKEDGV